MDFERYKGLNTINRVPIVQQVCENIKIIILSGDIPIGHKLPSEMKLCEQFGVGRGTVREALRLLQAAGFVEILQGRGAFVAKITEDDNENLVEWFVQNEVEQKDCIEIRTALEPLAISLAIRRCSDEDIKKLEKIHGKFMEAVKTQNVAKIGLYDAEFHNCIVNCSRNKLLISINKKISEGMVIFRSKTFKIEKNVDNAVGPHARILEAIKRRDSVVAEIEMRRHLDQIMIDLKEITDKKIAEENS